MLLVVHVELISGNRGLRLPVGVEVERHPQKSLFQPPAFDHRLGLLQDRRRGYDYIGPHDGLSGGVCWPDFQIKPVPHLLGIICQSILIDVVSLDLLYIQDSAQG